MFCPNCGTQNSETASTCTKCGFNLKGAAAPKFKGTMLMNQSPPGGGAPGAPAPAGPPPGMPAVQPLNPNLAGTVVGVSPAGMGASPIAAPPPAPPPPAGYGAPPPGYGNPGATAPLGAPGGYGAPPAQPGYGAPPGQGGYSPAGPPQGGVNPLGGTMAIDQMPNFGAGGYGPPAGPPPGPPPSPYGAPPPQQGGAFGAPAPMGGQPGFPPPQGAPPGGFGEPQQNPYGAPPPQQNPYGAPPQQNPYGAPPQGPGYGGPTGQEIQQFGQQAGAAIQAGFNAQPGGKPQVRNAVTQLLIAYAILVFAPGILGFILGLIGLGFLGSLAGLACFIVYGFFVKPMILEAQTAANNQDIKWWWQLVPGLNIYFDALKVPELITAAKTQRGMIQQKPTRSLVFYLFLFPYALALDLNDLAS